MDLTKSEYRRLSVSTAYCPFTVTLQNRAIVILDGLSYVVTVSVPKLSSLGGGIYTFSGLGSVVGTCCLLSFYFSGW